MREFLSVYKNDMCIANKVEEGNTFLKRFIGLMGQKAIHKNQGFYLNPCRSIHTFQMNFPIDVLFLSKDGIVLDIVHEMKPWRLKSACSNTVSTLELPAKTANKFNIDIGDKLELIKQGMGKDDEK